MIDEPAAGWRIVSFRVPGRRQYPDRHGWMYSTTRWKACPIGKRETPGIPHTAFDHFRHRHEAVRFTHDQMAQFGWCRRRRDFYPRH
jgi:hypothetical protein